MSKNEWSARQHLEAALQDAPTRVKLGYADYSAEYTLVRPHDLDATQIGYSVDPEGTSLVGTEEGDWRSTWIVIGYDNDLGDPVFVDLSDPDLPTLTAMHGAGAWEPDELAPTFQDFLRQAIPLAE